VDHLLNLFYVVIFALALGLVGALAVRRRVLFKMGARNFVRHRTHSALVVSGLLVGTAIISGAMVTGDSIDNFIVQSTYDSLDLVDVTVASPKFSYFNQSICDELRGDAELAAHADGVAPMISTVVSVEDVNSGQFESSVTLMAFDAAQDEAFGPFTLLDGTETYSAGLLDGEVALNAGAAEALDAGAGDTLKLRYRPEGESMGRESLFSVSFVVQDEGKGRYQLVPGVFMRLDEAQQILNITGKVNQVKISGTGDSRSGVDESDAIVLAVNGTLAASSDPGAAGLRANPIKQNSLEQSRQAGEMITMFITIFGSFSIIAGVILIINIFTMLAEERKSELGMARAVGMTRRDLMQMFLFEGSTYTIAAAALGTLGGLAIGYSLIFGVNNIFNIFADIKIPFYFRWTSLVNAFCMGGAITFLTIILASWRITNINIVRAIRDIEEPAQERASRLSVALGGVIIAVALAAFALSYGDLVVRYVAPCIAFIGMALMMRGFASPKLSFSTGGVGIIAWTLYAIATFFDEQGENTEYLFIGSGVFLVLAAVIIVMFNSEAVVALVSGTVGRVRSMRPVVKTAISHPLNKRFRTGMTVAMFTLVIYTIVMVSVFTSVFSINVDDTLERQGGGYQILGSTQMPVADLGNASIFDDQGNLTPIVSPTIHEDILRFEQLSMVLPAPDIWINGSLQDGGGMGFGAPSVLAVDDHFLTYNRFTFSEMAPAYSTPKDIWNAVRNDSSMVVWAGMAGFGGGEQVTVGTVVTIATSTGNQNFTVVGIMDQMILSGIFMTKQHAYAFFGAMPSTFVGNVVFLFEVQPGADVQAVTFGLERDFRALGMNTVNLREVIQQLLELINSIFMLFQIFLGLGLVVGIAGLGIITIRSVVERRREIGIMRAIGYARSKILASFVTEILFVCSLAVVIGIAVGIVVSYEIFTIMVEGVDVQYKVPWLDLAWIIGITYAASLACTIVPAIRASRIPPAEALRINE
jgi:putative ABC transport system permease protein